MKEGFQSFKDTKSWYQTYCSWAPKNKNCHISSVGYREISICREMSLSSLHRNMHSLPVARSGSSLTLNSISFPLLKSNTDPLHKQFLIPGAACSPLHLWDLSPPFPASFISLQSGGILRSWHPCNRTAVDFTCLHPLGHPVELKRLPLPVLELPFSTTVMLNVDAKETGSLGAQRTRSQGRGWYEQGRGR